MQFFLTEQFFKDEPDRVARLKEVMMIERKEQGQEALYRQLGAAMNHNTVNEVKDINVPTLIISGTSDPMAPVKNARFLAEQIPNSTLIEIPGGYHAFWVEKFEDACDTIKKFLSQ
jgi:pimeloyl-ACP methyl ester carboxylesterase